MTTLKTCAVDGVLYKESHQTESQAGHSACAGCAGYTEHAAFSEMLCGKLGDCMNPTDIIWIKVEAA